MAETGMETVLDFMEAVADMNWLRAIEDTQLTWQYGYDPTVFEEKAWLRWWRRFRGIEHRPTRGAPALAERVGPQRVMEVLKIGAPRMASSVLEQMPVTYRIARGDRMTRNVVVVRELGPWEPSERGRWGVNPDSLFRSTLLHSTDRMFTPEQIRAGVDMAEKTRASS